MTEKKKKYDIVHKGVCSTQTENFVAAKQFIIINEDGKRYLLVKLTNNSSENVTGATLFVEQFNDRGDKIAAESVRVCGFDGYPQKSFAVEEKILVASTCIDCRITVLEAEFGKFTYKSDDLSMPGYRFETEPEPEKKIPAEIMSKAGKKGITVEPRSLKMPTLILLISIIVIVAAFVAICIYTNRFVNSEDRFLHDGVYYSFVGDNRADDSDIYVVGVRGSRAEISIPAEIEGHRVVRVDAGAFLGNTNLKKVSFGGEIAIGKRAFYGCASLESIDLKNATDIADDAFNGCTSLRVVELEKVYGIGDNAFSGCVALTSLKIADGGPNITVGDGAFGGCESLRTVDISRTVVYGEDYALFDKCFNVTSLHLKNFECGSDERNITVLFGGTPALTSVIIDEIDTVGAGLCEGLSSVTTVRLNDVETPHIGKRAFFGCESLKEVIMSESVTRVGDEAFSGTAITAFDGSALEYLGDKAFSDCKRLATFTLFKDTELAVIGEAAFMNCEALGSVTIPTQVTAMRSQAFSGCKQLTSVTFDSDSELTYIAQSAFENCERLNVINIPAAVWDIGARAFAGCTSLSDLTLPAELTSVGDGAFAGAGLLKADLPASVKSIGFGAFDGCAKLQSLTVPFVGESRNDNRYLAYVFGAKSGEDGGAVLPTTLNTVTVTDSDAAYNNAFYGCSELTSIVYKKGLASVGDNAFRGCRALPHVELADGLKSIGVRAFSDCAALTEISVPISVTSIGRSAFSGCTSLATIVTPFVGASRSSNCFLAYMFGGETYEDASKIPASLKKVELTDTQTVGEGAFFGTTVGEIVLGDTTTVIAENAFRGNRKLNVITLPSGLTDIGTDAFLGCYFLYEVYNFSSLRLYIGSYTYGYVAFYALKIHESDEPRLSVASYEGYDFVQSDDKWYLMRYPEDETEYVLPAEVVTAEYSFNEYFVHDRVFIENKDITSVHIPSNAKSIGVEVFAGCENLTSVNVDNGVAVIGSGAFSGCIKLSLFIFPSGVTVIADELFNGCEALKNVTMPSSISRIGENAFLGCASLLKVEIPDDCAYISDGAFGGCTMLYSVNIPSACVMIGVGAFDGCGRIKSVTLPQGIGYIGSGAFSGCFKLYEVYNLSGYVIIPGSEDYGGVAKYAYAVHSSLDDTPLCNTTVNGLHYYKLDDEWCLVDYYGTDGNVEIGGFSFGTERVDDIKVIDYAFRYYDTIKSVKVGEQVSRIGSYAFGECGALESLVISAKKLVVSGGAFAECENLATLTVLSGDVEFGTEAFFACGLTSVSFTGGDFVIMDNVFFDNNSLDKLTVVCRSLSVYEMAFFDGLLEASIKCSDSFTADYMALYGSLLSKLSLQADDVVIFDQNFFGNDIREVSIVGNKSVYISSEAFNACGNLDVLSISGKKVEIDSSAFNDCKNAYAFNGIGELSITGEQIDIAASAVSSCVVKSLTVNGNELVFAAPFIDGSTVGALNILCTGNEIAVGKTAVDSTLSELVVRGKKVAIEERAFYMAGQLVSLEIAAEDLNIGYGAFFNQYNLKSATLSANKAAEIGKEAFSLCGGLERLVLPAALKTVGERVFGDCLSLLELDVPRGVTSIGDFAFANCASLTNLTLPSGLTSIGEQAFRNCIKLKSLIVPDTVRTIGTSAFMSCNGLENLTLSSALKVIEDFAFFECNNVAAITLPSGLTTVGKSAFFGCRSIKALAIPQSVTKIDENAFGGCTAMETLSFAGAPELFFGAFSGCSSLKSLVIPSGITKIPFAAFNACGALTALTIPNSVTTIEDYAFGGCSSLTTLTIPDSVTEIKDNAFAECEKLSSLTLPRGLGAINDGAFGGCNSLVRLTVPSGVTSIGNSAFENCYALTELILPNGLTSIGNSAFINCSALTELVLPSSLISIGENAFESCTALGRIVANTSGALNIGSFAFDGCNALAALELNNVASIGASAFADCFKLESLALNFKKTDNVESNIGSDAFKNCSSLTSVDIKADAGTAVYIFSSAFIGCGELTSLILPSTLNYIGPSAFSGCAKLQSVELPSALGSIGYNAFYGAVSLFSVCNKSRLDIEAGSEAHGGVAKYAVIVTDNRDKAKLTYAGSGANKFVLANGVWYIFDCEIDNGGYGLPESVTTAFGTINSYIIKCRTFDEYIDKIVIPKSVVGIQSNAFATVNHIYYRGTASEWSNISEHIGVFFSVSFYASCVHGSDEWTEIDGAISTYITMSTWSIVNDATCSETGKRERHCDRCGKKEEQEIPVNPFVHDFDENGTCKDCGVTVLTYSENEDGEQSIDD